MQLAAHVCAGEGGGMQHGACRGLQGVCRGTARCGAVGEAGGGGRAGRDMVGRAGGGVERDKVGLGSFHVGVRWCVVVEDTQRRPTSLSHSSSTGPRYTHPPYEQVLPGQGPCLSREGVPLGARAHQHRLLLLLLLLPRACCCCRRGAAHFRRCWLARRCRSRSAACLNQFLGQAKYQG